MYYHFKICLNYYNISKEYIMLYVLVITAYIIIFIYIC